MNTLLHTIWAYVEERAILLDTWSHEDFDENHEGYTETLEKFKNEYRSVREIAVSFPESRIDEAFEIPVIEADTVGTRPE